MSPYARVTTLASAKSSKDGPADQPGQGSEEADPGQPGPAGADRGGQQDAGCHSQKAMPKAAGVECFSRLQRCDRTGARSERR